MPGRTPRGARRAAVLARQLATEPVAFRRTEDAHRIDQRERMRPLAANAGYATRTLANLSAVASYENAHLRSDDPTGGSFPNAPRDTASFPGRDSRGRRNPRMARRAFA